MGMEEGREREGYARAAFTLPARLARALSVHPAIYFINIHNNLFNHPTHILALQKKQHILTPDSALSNVADRVGLVLAF